MLLVDVWSWIVMIFFFWIRDTLSSDNEAYTKKILGSSWSVHEIGTQMAYTNKMHGNSKELNE